MKTMNQPITIQLTRAQIQEAIQEWWRARTNSDDPRITTMQMHSSGGHAMTVTLSPLPKELNNGKDS